MDQYLVAGIALLGVLGQWLVSSRASAKRDGAVEEKLRSHSARLARHGEEIDEVRAKQERHGEEIAGVKAKLEARGHAR